MVKRVIGTAGETIRICDEDSAAKKQFASTSAVQRSTVSVDGKKFDEPYAAYRNSGRHPALRSSRRRATQPTGEAAAANGTADAAPGCKTWTVPKDAVFVLGDNRNQSTDSRAFGPVPLEGVIGTALYVIRTRSGEDVGRTLTKK